VRPCQFGESDHFEDRAEAVTAVEKRLAEAHGGSSSSLKKPAKSPREKLKAELDDEPTGMFAVRSQKDLDTLIHRSKGDPCPGDCGTCGKFNRVAEKVYELSKRNVIVSLKENDSKTSVGKYRAWCNNCQDGENANLYDAADWADRHISSRHS
jgi:hypothetical protein